MPEAAAAEILVNFSAGPDLYEIKKQNKKKSLGDWIVRNPAASQDLEDGPDDAPPD